MQNLYFILALGTIVNCTSFNRRDNAADLNSTRGENSFVIQGQSQTYAYSSQGRQYWLKSRSSGSTKNRAIGALATGESVAAMDLARATLAKNPSDESALSVLAAGLVTQKNYDLAFYYAEELEKVNPQSAVAANIKGLATMLRINPRTADFMQAKQYFRESMNRDAQDIAAGLNLGHLELELGQADHAREVFTEVAKRANGQCRACELGVGIASLRAGKPDLAKSALEGILSKNPGDADALYHLALVYKNGYNDPVKAKSYLTTLLKRSKTTNLAVRERASATLRKINGESTVEERQAIAKSKTDDDTMLLEASYKGHDD